MIYTVVGTASTITEPLATLADEDVSFELKVVVDSSDPQRLAMIEKAAADAGVILIRETAL